MVNIASTGNTMTNIAWMVYIMANIAWICNIIMVNIACMDYIRMNIVLIGYLNGNISFIGYIKKNIGNIGMFTIMNQLWKYFTNTGTKYYDISLPVFANRCQYLVLLITSALNVKPAFNIHISLEVCIMNAVYISHIGVIQSAYQKEYHMNFKHEAVCLRKNVV